MKLNPGVVNVYKEPGYTSHDVVAIMRKIFGTKKVGHTGTLDPNAEGVLPICIERATKLAEFLTAQDKTYVADLILGITTDTGDTSGEVLTRCTPGADVDDVIEGVIASFCGEYLQTPPMYSAIKIGGKKLYQLARQGITVERKPRPVIIHRINLIEAIPGGYRLQVSCGKGTYIRSLCEDIGRALGCGATMGRLVRTRSGQFDIRDAIKLVDMKERNIEELIMPIDQILPYPACHVQSGAISQAINGNPLELTLIDGDVTDKCWLWGEGRLIGLYRKDANILRPEVML